MIDRYQYGMISSQFVVHLIFLPHLLLTTPVGSKCLLTHKNISACIKHKMADVIIKISIVFFLFSWRLPGDFYGFASGQHASYYVPTFEKL